MTFSRDSLTRILGAPLEQSIGIRLLLRVIIAIGGGMAFMLLGIVGVALTTDLDVRAPAMSLVAVGLFVSGAIAINLGAFASSRPVRVVAWAAALFGIGVVVDTIVLQAGTVDGPSAWLLAALGALIGVRKQCVAECCSK